MPDEQSKTPAEAPITISEIQRTEDFVARYANNVQIETSAFDLKLTFGILDQAGATKVPPVSGVDQHTSISLSWPEVKLLVFFMQLHLAGYEAENGKVRVPINALPPEPSAVLPPQFDNEAGRKGVELIRKMRAEFIASLTQP